MLRPSPVISLVFVLAGVGVAALGTLPASNTYEATAVVQVADLGEIVAAPYSAESFAIWPSYVDLVKVPTVLQPVAATPGISITEAQLSHDVSATSSGSGHVIHIRVSNRSARTAARYANAVAARFAIVVVNMASQPDTGLAAPGAPTVTARVVSAAKVPALVVSAPWAPTLTFGGVGGLLVALLVAAARRRKRREGRHLLVGLA